MTLSVGQIAATSGGRILMVWGRTRHDLIVLPLERGEPMKRAHVRSTDGVLWDDPEYAMPGYVDVARPMQFCERLLRVVGNASEALQSDCLKAQIRELEGDETPTPSWPNMARTHQVSSVYAIAA